MHDVSIPPPHPPPPPHELSRGRAGREYYSSICMRAVNQSIGRSIRHAGDYASILLVDERYQDEQVKRDNVLKQLVGWWVSDFPVIEKSPLLI